MRVHYKRVQGLWSILTVLAVGLGLGVSTVRAQGTATDSVLLQMRDAFANNDARQLADLLPRARGHVLEPWADYWAMRSRLESANTAEIRAALARHVGTYQEDRLRNDWLLLLARRGDWVTFAQELPLYRMNDDREVQCYALQRQHADEGRDVAAAVAERWLAQREADHGCAQAATALISAGQMGHQVAWQRARQGMERGKRRLALQAVEALNDDWAATAAQIYDAPQRYLDDKFTAVRPRTKELVTLALIRLAATNADAAAEHADKLRWRTQLTEEELSSVWGAIGRRAALRLSDEALGHFQRASNRHLTDDQLAWKTRAALRASAWGEVRLAIESMSAGQREQPVWRYWLARSLQAAGTPESRRLAQELLTGMAGSEGFYEQLALEATGQAVVAAQPVQPLTPAELAEAQALPGLQRALKAIALGLRSEGVREWNYEIALHSPGGMSDRELLAAAEVACQHQIWDRCINTSLRTRKQVDDRQRFPLPYRDAVVARARHIGLDPAYVYGLIRQESRFVMNARSHVGASGLMQVMPATAQWTARKIGLHGFKPHHINERDTNITIGTAYLKLALDDFEGSMALAAAAYNAGPGRARNWRNGPVLEAPIWIENIPFDETRDYVKRVLANTTHYAAILQGQPQRLSDRLAPIGPRTSNAAAENRDLP